MHNSKSCADCNQVKPVDAFYNNRTTADGKSVYCKNCLSYRNSTYRKANPEKVKQTNRASKKRNYAKVKQTRKKYEATNRELVNARKRLWAKNNKEKVKEINQRSYRKNPGLFAENRRRRYAVLKNVETFAVSAKDYQKLYSQACLYCQSTKQIEVDHVHPLSKGGRHSVGNLAPACLQCNRSKKDLFVMQWRLRQKRN